MTSCEHEGLYMLLDSKTHRSLSLPYHYKLVSVHRSFWSLNTAGTLSKLSTTLTIIRSQDIFFCLFRQYLTRELNIWHLSQSFIRPSKIYFCYLRKSQCFLLMFSAKQVNYRYHFYNVFVMTWVPFYYSTYAKFKVTQLFPSLITFKPLIMSNKVRDIVK